MKRQRFMYLIVALLFVSGAASAQGTGSSKSFSTSIPDENLLQKDASEISIGQPGTVFRYLETFGETGVPYLADSTHLYHPIGLGLDGSGNLWVVEASGTRAMKYSGNGTFLASIGTAGLAYLADESHFAGPTDVTVDGKGDVWIADAVSARVVQFDSSGNYMTQLGVTWETGTDNAHFDYPFGIAFDSAGKIYVSDLRNHRIQVFGSSGAYSTTIGVTGVSGSDNAHLDSPEHIAIDADDNLYVADNHNHRVQIFNASHNYIDTLGVTDIPGSDNDHFYWPGGVTVDANYIYVNDDGNHRVQIFDRATRVYQDTLGSQGSGNYQFNWPDDVAVDSAGNVYVADGAINHRVMKYNSSLLYERTFGATGVPYLTDDYHYNQPNKVAIDMDGDIAVLEDEGRGYRLIVLDAGGVPQFTIGEAGVGGSDNDHFSDARGVAFDAAGNIYVGDCANHRVQIFSSTGVYSTTLGSYGQGNDQFFCPSGLTFDSGGNLYVADTLNQRVQIFNNSLNYVATLGETGVSGSDNDQFDEPSDVAVDADGNIYVVDTFNHRVQKFDSSLDWQMTLGVTGECAADVSEDFEHFCVPKGVAVDGSGNVYVSEWWNPRVQVFNSDGAYLTTIGGAWGNRSNQFRQLPGVAVDSVGNVYIADMLNHRIQKFAPGVPDWRQVNINGFGERFAIGVAALEEFNGRLYAGTATSSWPIWKGAQVYRADDGLTWSAASEPGFGVYTDTRSVILDLAVFDGQLYAGVGWSGRAGEAWRSPDGLTWEAVTTDGFGDGSNIAIASLTVFNGVLYAGTGNADTGAQIWRSASGDPGDWTKVAPDKPSTTHNWQVTGFANFNGMLYAAMESEDENSGPLQVWRSTNGSAWDTVVADGFGDSDNFSSGGFALFGGYLYLGTQNNLTGAQLWRTSDGTNWKQVISDGFGDSANTKVEMLTVFASQLVAEVSNIETGLKILRSSDGAVWQQINTDGFGDSNNFATLWNNSTTKYRGYLYFGTFNLANGGEIWRYDFEEKTIYLPMIRH